MRERWKGADWIYACGHSESQVCAKREHLGRFSVRSSDINDGQVNSLNMLAEILSFEVSLQDVAVGILRRMHDALELLPDSNCC